jgi:uncharacterized protein involved in cysteine biosynthesis
MLEALSAALRSQLRPKMLGVALIPLAAAVLVWVLVFAWFGSDLLDVLARSAGGLAAPMFGEGGRKTVEVFIAGLGAIGALLLFFPLVSATALLVTSIIAMPIALPDIAAREYPQLERRRFGSNLGSIANALFASLLYLLLFLLSLPLWLIPFGALVIPLLLGAWLNARMFRYDALAEHADAAEYRAIRHQRRGDLFGLGLVAALLQIVPLLNLVSPVYSGLSFIHYGLAELQRRRTVVTPVSQLP